MNRENDIQYWLDAAKRKDAEGNHATAISFRNIAWLLEHPEGWNEFCDAVTDTITTRSQSEQKEVV